MINLANMDCCDCGSLFFVIMDFQKKKPKAVCINKFLTSKDRLQRYCTRWGWIQERPKSQKGYTIIKSKSGGIMLFFNPSH